LPSLNSVVVLHTIGTLHAVQFQIKQLSVGQQIHVT